MAKSASITKLAITSYSDNACQSKQGTYQAMLNPEKINYRRSIDYNEQQAPGSSAPSQKYKATPPTSLSFDLTIDCTGVVDAKRTDLSEELKNLRDVVYDYHGNVHRPYFVIIRWGIGETFKGVLTSIDTTYSLFDPDGVPLRATVSLSFKSYLDPKAVAQEEDNSSPDLTHRVPVVAGDTLPLISNRIYGDPTYFVQLAAINKLDKLRTLTPGTVLIVPPLVPDTGTGKEDTL